MQKFDAIVVGGGPGGYECAIRLSQNGLKTALVEEAELGGTCLNRGCIPTKTLLHSADIYHDAKNGAPFGVSADNVTFDYAKIIERKNAVSKQLSNGVAFLEKSHGITVFADHATLTDRQTVHLAGGEDLTCDHLIVATGSSPARIPIPGVDLPGVVDSTGLLNMTTCPKHIIIVGGGVIGVEFATFYSDLGCEVTVIEGLDRLLPGMDRELGQNLAQLLKKQGVRVFANSMVQRVEQGEDGLTVHFTTRGKEDFVTGEAVLSAFGRSPNWKGLFADGLQPETDGRRIHTDENGQTSITGIYAIGDVSSPVQLAHVAAAQGTACVERLAGRTPSVRLDLVPGCVYCRPEIASVGLTEADGKARDIPVKVGKCTLFANARTMIAGTGRSFMKVVAHAQTGVLLGAQLMCEHATDMIGQLSQAIANGMTARQLLAAMRPHPTFEEALGEALEELVAKLPE